MVIYNLAFSFSVYALANLTLCVDFIFTTFNAGIFCVLSSNALPKSICFISATCVKSVYGTAGGGNIQIRSLLNISYPDSAE